MGVYLISTCFIGLYGVLKGFEKGVEGMAESLG